MDEFDVLVVGSGTGGQTAPFELNDVGLKVAVSEKSDRRGGRGLFPGSGKHSAGACSLGSGRLT
jgi:pyruvate/2-oxoglutarate dehydrogenase complex dihydrolipoamide dehydrogenase (E3) component